MANNAAATRMDSAFGYLTFAASLGQALGPLAISLVGGASVRPDTQVIFLLAVCMSPVLFVTTFVRLGRGQQRQRREPRRRKCSKGGAVSLLEDPRRGPCAGHQRHRPGRGGPDHGLPSGAGNRARAHGGNRGCHAHRPRRVLHGVPAPAGAGLTEDGAHAAAGGQPGRLSTVALAAAAVPMPVWLLFVVMAVLGLGLGIGQPLTMSWLSAQAPAGQRGRALALRLAGNRVGQVVLPERHRRRWRQASALAGVFLGVRRGGGRDAGAAPRASSWTDLRVRRGAPPRQRLSRRACFWVADDGGSPGFRGFPT